MSPISAAPRGMTRRASVSPARKIAYSPAAEARPSAASRGPMRTRFASRSATSASVPRARPVIVMRSQKRSRRPRKVSPKAVYAPATASASRLTRASAREERRDDQPGNEQEAERGVQLGRLEIDHRDRSLLSGRAELRRADLPDQKRQRGHRQQRPRRKEPHHDTGGERQVRADHQGDVKPVRRVAPCADREG